MHLTKRRGFWGIRMEDFGVLWVWGFRGDSHGILLWVWDGYGDWIWGLKSNPHGSSAEHTVH